MSPRHAGAQVCRATSPITANRIAVQPLIPKASRITSLHTSTLSDAMPFASAWRLSVVSSWRPE